jgi:uncharacterized membrane protein
VTPLAKRLLIALCVSLGLNLLAAGIVLGRSFDRGGQRGPARARDGGVPRGPEKPEAMLHRGPGRRDPAMLESRRSARRAREEARAILEKEPFDSAAFDAALARLRSETTRGQELLHRRVSENAKQGTPEQRRKLGAVFGRALDRAGPRP